MASEFRPGALPAVVFGDASMISSAAGIGNSLICGSTKLAMREIEPPFTAKENPTQDSRIDQLIEISAYGEVLPADGGDIVRQERGPDSRSNINNRPRPAIEPFEPAGQDREHALWHV